MAKKSREEWKIYENVFDKFTVRTLWTFISREIIDGLKSPIALGKESNVFIAEKADENLIIKVYRLESCDFNRMYEYIHGDPRAFQTSKHKRKVIFSWVQREFRNLLRAREFGVKCPKPIDFKNNVLIMEMIGDPALKLKDLPPKNPIIFLKLLIQELNKLTKAGLAHGDLSEYNILNDNEKPVLIDFSHSTPINSPLGQELFQRDLANVVRYFKKFKIELTIEDLVEKITNLS